MKIHGRGKERIRVLGEEEVSEGGHRAKRQKWVRPESPQGYSSILV